MEIREYSSRIFQKLLDPPYRWHQIIQQFYFFANQSLGIVLLCVTFAAVVTIMESSYHMRIVIQNDSMVPGFAAMLILRELGAIVMALLVTSRVGAGLAAEIATMKITEQIDALKMLNIDPIDYLVVPRLIAAILGGIVLSVLANLVCLYFAMVVSLSELNFTAGMFLAALKRFVGFQDLVFAAIKGAFFGAVIPLVSCFQGFRSKPGAEGVGFATTQSVVIGSVTIIIVDFILSYVFSFFY